MLNGKSHLTSSCYQVITLPCLDNILTENVIRLQLLTAEFNLFSVSYSLEMSQHLENFLVAERRFKSKFD